MTDTASSHPTKATAQNATRSRSGHIRFLSLCRRSRLGVFGGLLLMLLIFAAVLGPLIHTLDPLKQQLLDRNQPPGWTDATGQMHYLGTDPLGRDMLARLLYGLRLSLVVGFGATLIAALIGVLTGLLAGYSGGPVDTAIMRIVDIQMSFPYLLLAIVWAAFFGTSFWNMVIIVAVRGWVEFARMVRALVLSVKEQTYVEAAIAVGATKKRVVSRHILPQVFAPTLIIFSLQVGSAIILESTLGFLGLGVNPPTPTLGGILSGGRSYMVTAWWVITIPGILIMLIVLAVNALGDGLRDILDPKLRV